MKARRKIQDIYVARLELLRIKRLIEMSRGRRVQWQKNKDGRKRQVMCYGTIQDAFQRHFMVTLDNGCNTSFLYVDLLVEDVVLEDGKTGEDILASAKTQLEPVS